MGFRGPEALKDNLEQRGDCQTLRKSYKATGIVGWVVGWKIDARSPTLKRQRRCLRLLLLVANRFQPVPNTSVLPFLNGDVRHGRAWRRTVPMLLAGRYPDHVSRTYVFDCAAPSLHAAYTRRHDQRVAQGMGVPFVGAPGSNVTLPPVTRAGSGA